MSLERLRVRSHDLLVTRELSYLGMATIQQGDRRTEASCALYSDAGEARTGRYWSPALPIQLLGQDAVIRFHDATEAEVRLVHVRPDSGRFEVIGPLRNLRRY